MATPKKKANYIQPGSDSNPVANTQIGVRTMQNANPMVATGAELTGYQQPLTDKDDPQGTIRGYKDNQGKGL